MNYKMMGRFIGQIISLEAVLMIPALLISVFYGESHTVQAFLLTIGIAIVIGALLLLVCRKAGRIFGARDGLSCVGLSWIALSLLGCLPFWFSREIPRFMDAFFVCFLFKCVSK